jgi:predicted Zn finger-like uncharacterized protein
MAAPSPQTVVIACPKCGTRYQLARDALGKKRMVKCANCQTAWEAFPVKAEAPAPAPALPTPPAPVAPPDEDRLFPAEEARLDAAFEAAEKAETAAAEPSIAAIAAAIAPKPKPPPAPDKTLIKQRLMAFAQRQKALHKRLPVTRMRNAARQVALGALIIVIAVAILFRENIVRQFPDLAGGYSAIGLGVNIVGLEFADVRTLKTLRDGSEMLMVEGRIVSATDRAVLVPQVVVTLLDAGGQPVYEWSVTPKTRDLEPGESVRFETQLVRPPEGAQGVRLTFMKGHASIETPVTTTPETEHPA